MKVIFKLVLALCVGPAAAPSPTSAPSPLPVVELKYRIVDQIGRPWYCDPDFFPVAVADEKELARQRLPEMQKDADTYAAILRHNALGAGASLKDDEALAVYHDWKDLQRVPLDPTGPSGVYGSVFVVQSPTAAKSERIELRVDTGGRITVLYAPTAVPRRYVTRVGFLPLARPPATCASEKSCCAGSTTKRMGPGSRMGDEERRCFLKELYQGRIG